MEQAKIQYAVNIVPQLIARVKPGNIIFFGEIETRIRPTSYSDLKKTTVAMVIKNELTQEGKITLDRAVWAIQKNTYSYSAEFDVMWCLDGNIWSSDYTLLLSMAMFATY